MSTLKKIPETTWVIREAYSNELAFIYATWLNSYRYDSILGRSCKNTVYFAEYPKILDSILHRSSVLVAYFKETPEVILSYIVFEKDCLHYIFTKEIYQKNGIAMSLIFEAFKDILKKPIQFSHRTFMAEPIIQRYEDRLNYNPFKLYQLLNQEESRGH